MDTIVCGSLKTVGAQSGPAAMLTRASDMGETERENAEYVVCVLVCVGTNRLRLDRLRLRHHLRVRLF